MEAGRFQVLHSEAEFKEFELQLKFKPQLKYGWFHLKLCSMFKIYPGAQLKPVFSGFKMQLKFIKFGHRTKKTKSSLKGQYFKIRNLFSVFNVICGCYSISIKMLELIKIL